MGRWAEPVPVRGQPWAGRLAWWWWGLVTSPRRGAARCSLVFCVATPARPQQCGGRLHAGEHEEIHRRKIWRNGDHPSSVLYLFMNRLLHLSLSLYDIKQLSIMAHDSLWAWKILYSGEKSEANSYSLGPKELPRPCPCGATSPQFPGCSPWHVLAQPPASTSAAASGRALPVPCREHF